MKFKTGVSPDTDFAGCLSNIFAVYRMQGRIIKNYFHSAVNHKIITDITWYYYHYGDFYT